MQHRRDAFKVRCGHRRVGEIEHPRITAQVMRERPDLVGVAAGQNWTEMAIFRHARGEPTGVAVGPVDHPRSAHHSSDNSRRHGCAAQLNILKFPADREGHARRLLTGCRETTDVDRISNINRHHVFTELNPTCIALCDDTKDFGRNDVRIV